MRPRSAAIAAGITATLVLGACGGSTTLGARSASPSATQTSEPPRSSATPTEAPISPESPVPAESNPPGDIPDNTAYIPYRSASGGFTIKTPEGWARTTGHGSVVFTDKLNTVMVSWAPASSAPTITTVKKTEVPQLKRTVRAFTLGKVSTAQLPAGTAVLVTYQANSDPNPVTGKQYRQDVQRYSLFHNGQEVVLTLLSPVGADNVDPWRIVTESLQWN